MKAALLYESVSYMHTCVCHGQSASFDCHFQCFLFPFHAHTCICVYLYRHLLPSAIAPPASSSLKPSTTTEAPVRFSQPRTHGWPATSCLLLSCCFPAVPGVTGCAGTHGDQLQSSQQLLQQLYGRRYKQFFQTALSRQDEDPLYTGQEMHWVEEVGGACRPGNAHVLRRWEGHAGQDMQRSLHASYSTTSRMRMTHCSYRFFSLTTSTE